MKTKIYTSLSIFFLFFIVFFPLGFLGDFQLSLSHFIFSDFVEYFSKNIFELSNLRVDFSSDSLSMLVLACLLFLISVVFSFITPRKYALGVIKFSTELCFIYISVVLWKYGFDKIFKAQFFLPEPNILYSKFGDLDRDILFWSTMGTSRLYSFLTGFIEVFAGTLLIFNKTKTVGALLSTTLFMNIVFINLGFDISVKFFSFILLLMSIFLLKDDVVVLFRFLILKTKQQLNPNPSFENRKNHAIFVGIKTMLLSTALILILQPFYLSRNFNDDRQKRPFLHGCFRVTNSKDGLKYVFFHRDYYMIFGYESGKMTDFHYSLNPDKTKIILEDYSKNIQEINFNYSKKDSLLILSFPNKYTLEAKEENWSKMRVLQPKFHWSVESIK